MKLAQVRDQTGAMARQLRTWEQEGLLAPARGSGGQREYSPADVALARRIRELRGAGLGLGDIRILVRLGRARTRSTETEALRRARAILRRTQAQIAACDEFLAAVIAGTGGTGS